MFIRAIRVNFPRETFGNAGSCWRRAGFNSPNPSARISCTTPTNCAASSRPRNCPRRTKSWKSARPRPAHGIAAGKRRRSPGHRKRRAAGGSFARAFNVGRLPGCHAEIRPPNRRTPTLEFTPRRRAGISQARSRATGANGNSSPTCRIPSPRRFWWNWPAARAPKRIVATLQLEVARRLMAQADDDDYGMLTLLVQLDFEPREWFKIPPGCFFPRTGRGFGLRGSGAPRATAAAGKSARRIRQNRQARLFAAAEDDAEAVESRIGRRKNWRPRLPN